MPRHKELSDDSKRAVTKAIYTATQIEEVILKGHLYIEYFLNELFLANWPSEGEKLLDRFSFEQKVVIAEGTSLLKHADVVANLRSINQIRNSLAHSLFPGDIEAKVLEIPVLDFEARKSITKPLLRAKVSILVLCSYLVGLTHTLRGIAGDPPDWLLDPDWLIPEQR